MDQVFSFDQMQVVVLLLGVVMIIIYLLYLSLCWSDKARRW